MRAVLKLVCSYVRNLQINIVRIYVLNHEKEMYAVYVLDLAITRT